MSLNVETGLDSELDKENGLYSLALNRRNSSRTEAERVPFGELQISDATKPKPKPQMKKRPSKLDDKI